jgi:hypothetical protein
MIITDRIDFALCIIGALVQPSYKKSPLWEEEINKQLSHDVWVRGGYE